MRIIVFSDSHRHYDRVHRLFETTHLSTDLYIFLGDGEGDLELIPTLYPGKEILSAAGNCDFRSMNPLVGETTVCGKKIVYTHGHMQMVRFGISGLKSLAEQNGADIALFGHTHIRYLNYENGVYYLNPGSLGEPRDGKAPSYAIIDILRDGGILASHAELT